MREIVILKSHLSRMGGAEKYTWKLSHALKSRGYRVTLLTSGIDTPNSCAFNIVSCKEKALSFFFVKTFDKFCHNYLKQHPSSLVFGLDRNRFQTHLRASNGVHAAFLDQRRKQEGWLKTKSFACNPLHRALLQIEKESFESPKLEVLITNSHMVKEEILHYYRVDLPKIQVVHNGVDWKEKESSFARWQEARSETFHRLGLCRDHFHLLFIGNNYQRKGLEPLLKGLQLLKKSPIHLSVVGRDKRAHRFLTYVHKLGLSDKVTFFHRQEETTPLYQMADALIIPSFYDPFANVTVEALSMGVPVISSKTNGGHEVLTPENGHIIEELNDPFAMKQALETALNHPKTQANALRIRNSIAHLDFSHVLQNLLDKCKL